MKYKYRKNTRLKIFDYNSVGAYFITICTQNKEHLLSEIKLTFVGTDVPDGPQTSKEIFVELTEYGKIADKYINQLNDFYENISVDDYIIMPNHIHLLINIRENGPSLACESRRSLQGNILLFRNLFQHSSVFAIKSLVKIFGK